MEYRYRCWMCGEFFTRESERKLTALRYCPECKKKRQKELVEKWREKCRQEALGGKRSNKTDKYSKL